MKFITLTQGKKAVVDDNDYGFISQWKWVANYSSGCWYAVRYEDKKAILMHRVLLGLRDGEEADHRNRQGLDNRRANLRRCTRTQNQQNRKGWVRKDSMRALRFKGVYWSKRRSDGSLRASPWCTQIRVEGKKIVRFHRDEESAARSYNLLASQFFGEFACLNTI